MDLKMCQRHSGASLALLCSKTPSNTLEVCPLFVILAGVVVMSTCTSFQETVRTSPTSSTIQIAVQDPVLRVQSIEGGSTNVSQ